VNEGFSVVIPARHASQRLPGKPLLEIHGRPMIQWVCEVAHGSEAEQVIVATDDARIADAVEAFGGQARMTRADHQSGTDRLLEVAEQLGWTDDRIVVNLQGDEPLMDARNLTQVARNLVLSGCDMATLYIDIDAEQARDPNRVKLVRDARGHALYFSRAPIPHVRDGEEAVYCGHLGLYAYRVGFLRLFAALPPSPLERYERLEQLRALHHGYRIHAERARVRPGPGVDTAEDLQRVRRLLERRA
jgi:3-deoxy-manno-octulosonate cytidylyltransferase (CMP-KDO synthetase)